MINYTIIIPHYNIPNLLMRCLASIPVREDIQVIVVDDCSPDFATYKEHYPELSRPYLELYQTPKGGSAGRARNVGLEHANGKWLIFIDADDFFVDNMQELLDKSVDSSADIVFYDTRAVLNTDLSQVSNRNFYHHYFSEYVETKDDTLMRYCFQSLWGKVFRRSMVMGNHLKFDETRYSNDAYFSFTAGYFARDIEVRNKCLFVVTEREGSLASSQFGQRKPSLNECEIRLGVAIRMREFAECHNVIFPEKEVMVYMSKIRSGYKKAYFKHMVCLFFVHPSYIVPMIKKDFSFILKIIRHAKP